MKAVVLHPNSVLVVEDLPLPVPDDDQVLLKIVNTGFCGSDHSSIETGGAPDGIILGHEVSATVARVGRAVKGIREAGRNTQGVRLVNLEQGDRLQAIATVISNEVEEKVVEGDTAE